jgi:hypothetical protein
MAGLRNPTKFTNEISSSNTQIFRLRNKNAEKHAI